MSSSRYKKNIKQKSGSQIRLKKRWLGDKVCFKTAYRNGMTTLTQKTFK